MGRPVQRTIKHTTTTTSEFVAVQFPDPAVITQVNVASTQATFTLTIYNREIVGSALDVSLIRDNGSGNCRIDMGEEHNYVVGDSIVVAGNSVGGYNTTHVVTAVLSTGEIHTDQSYSANGAGGTATQTLPTTHRPAYEVLEATNGASNAIRFVGDRLFLSEQHDLRDANNPQAKLYLLIASAAVGTYTISIRGIQQTP